MDDAERYVVLRSAVSQLYYSAIWKSDRLTDEIERNLWENVRDAAELTPGKSPKPLPKWQPETKSPYEL